MRALAMIASVLLMGVSLSSCDMSDAAQKHAEAKAPCHCIATSGAATSTTESTTRTAAVPPMRHHYRRHRYYGQTGYHDSSTGGSEKSTDGYGYDEHARADYNEDTTEQATQTADNAPMRHHYRWHRYDSQNGTHGSFTSQSEKSVDSYNYVSRSRVAYNDGGNGYSSGGTYSYGASDTRGRGYNNGYGYSSGSRAGYGDNSYGYSGGGAYSYGASDTRGQSYYNSGITWMDGYGRGYYAGPRPTVAQTMTGQRLDAYHGYDEYCPEGQDAGN